MKATLKRVGNVGAAAGGTLIAIIVIRALYLRIGIDDPVVRWFAILIVASWAILSLLNCITDFLENKW